MKALMLGLLLPFSVSAKNIVPPVIEKLSYGPDVAERCGIYQDHVLIERNDDVQLIPYTLRNEVYTLIEEAALEQTMEFQSEVCHGPQTVINALDVELYSTGDCETVKKQKSGKASIALRQIIDEYCPTTF